MAIVNDEGTYSSPLHLSSESWVDFELRAALNLLRAMEDELKKLKLRITIERVHKSRVSLRRWFSIWSFLTDDGWEEKRFRKKVIKPLRSFLKELGDLRDCDVNIETAGKLHCVDHTLDDLKDIRKKLRRRIQKSLHELNPERLSENIEKYLQAKAGRLISDFQFDVQDHSAFAHFDRYLTTHEEQVKKLSLKEATPELLHKLRLAIKKWRYLLTECMGVTNAELVNAQTLLGEIHDFDRLEPLLIEEEGTESPAIQLLRKERKLLVQKFEELKDDLPYGLRPGQRSYKAWLKSGQDESDQEES